MACNHKTAKWSEMQNAMSDHGSEKAKMKAMKQTNNNCTKN